MKPVGPVNKIAPLHFVRDVQWNGEKGRGIPETHVYAIRTNSPNWRSGSEKTPMVTGCKIRK